MNNKKDIKLNKPFNIYGTSISETEIHPALLAYKRSQIVEKNFCLGYNSIVGVNYAKRTKVKRGENL